MDIKEFEKKMTPAAKRSKLEPFRLGIFELKNKGYANWQIGEWLAENGVKVSQEAVRKFIQSRSAEMENKEATSQKKPPPIAAGKLEQEKGAVEREERLKQNPLYALEVAPKEGEYNPMPKHKFERDDS